MEVLHARCAGLDVHKDTVVAGVRLAGNGPTRTEVRTFGTTTPELLALSAWLAEHGCTHIAMEATGIYWRPVWHILSDGEFTLILANAAHVKNVPGRKTDIADALWLADLLAHGLIRPSFVPEQATQEMRALRRTDHQAGLQLRRYTGDSRGGFCLGRYVADNRLGELSAWDDVGLGEIMLDLSLPDVDVSLELTGFAMGEIDLRIEGLEDANAKAAAAQ